MNTRWLLCISGAGLLSSMLGCTEPTPAPPARPAADRPTHFASDLERSLDQAKALQGQLDQMNQKSMQAIEQGEGQ